MTGNLSRCVFSSPLGHIVVEASRRGIRRVSLAVNPASLAASLAEPAEPSDAPSQEGLLAAQGAGEIREYLEGRRRRFNCPLDLAGLGGFTRAVLLYIEEAVPFGTTATYGEVATRIGHPKAARAVGRSLAANPAPILIPCHRIVGRSGPGGYSPGEDSLVAGIDLKLRLLALEGLEERRHFGKVVLCP